MIYLDSSAIVKLVVAEPGSAALSSYVEEHEEHVSSALARVEVMRALRRADQSELTIQRAERVLSSIALVRIDEPLLIGAAAQEPRELRSLDAIHLATALSIDGVDVLVTYDPRLSAAAVEVGLAVAVPT